VRIGNRVVWVLLAILSGLIVGSYLVISYNKFSYNYPPHDWLEIVYVAANQTSREIFCKIRNTGNANSILEGIRVNGSKVSTMSKLPITIEPVGDYKTCVFKYDGPWKGSILIDFYTSSCGEYERWGKLVDLQAASSNPIEGAYPSRGEILVQSLHLWFSRHLGEITVYMEVVLWCSIVIFVAVIVLLLLRNLSLLLSWVIRTLTPQKQTQ